MILGTATEENKLDFMYTTYIRDEPARPGPIRPYLPWPGSSMMLFGGLFQIKLSDIILKFSYKIIIDFQNFSSNYERDICVNPEFNFFAKVDFCHSHIFFYL